MYEKCGFVKHAEHEGYGALLAVRHALAEEFGRRVECGLMDISLTKRGITMILHDNPKALFKL